MFTLLQDWSALVRELKIVSKVVEHVTHFTCLGSLVISDWLVSDEISAQIRQAHLAFASLQHL